MALNLFSRYPGRANPASIDYPQGSFKNKTAPTATDGTLLEQDWANDFQGFLQSLLKYRDLVANGEVDKVGASQYFDALFSDPSETLRGMPLVATASEALAKTSKTKMLTPGSLIEALPGVAGNNFNQTFPTGMRVIQFEANVSPGLNTITLPAAFPSALTGVYFADVIYSMTGSNINVQTPAWDPGASDRTKIIVGLPATNPSGSVKIMAWGN